MHHEAHHLAVSLYWQRRLLSQVLLATVGSTLFVASLETVNGLMLGSHIELCPDEYESVLERLMSLIREWRSNPHLEVRVSWCVCSNCQAVRPAS